MTLKKKKECLQFKFKMRWSTFWLLCSQQLSSVSFAADLHFVFSKSKATCLQSSDKNHSKKDDDDGCSRRSSLKKDFYHRNLFWVDASPLSLRLQPLHIVHVYRWVFFECVSTSAQPKRQTLSTSICTDRQQPARLSACVIAPLWLTARAIGFIRHSLFVCIIPCVYAVFIAPRLCVTRCRAYCHCTFIHDSPSHVVSTDAQTENLFVQCDAFVWSTPREIKVYLRSKRDTDMYFLHLLCASFLMYPGSLWKLSKHGSNTVNCGGQCQATPAKHKAEGIFGDLAELFSVKTALMDARHFSNTLSTSKQIKHIDATAWEAGKVDINSETLTYPKCQRISCFANSVNETSFGDLQIRAKTYCGLKLVHKTRTTPSCMHSLMVKLV